MTDEINLEPNLPITKISVVSADSADPAHWHVFADGRMVRLVAEGTVLNDTPGTVLVAFVGDNGKKPKDRTENHEAALESLTREFAARFPEAKIDNTHHHRDRTPPAAVTAPPPPAVKGD
jgi:hypothetical protein